MTRPGFITGLAAESRALRRGARAYDAAIQPQVVCAGARPAKARSESQRLVAEGAAVLVSFGVAGGLDPAHPAGTLLLPETVSWDDGPRLSADADIHDGLRRAASGTSMTTAPLIGCDQVIASVAGKAALRARSGAAAVDMESHVVAAVAHGAGVPFVVIRAVVDGADSALPSSVLGAVTPDGRSRGGLVAARLCLKPWQLPTVRRLQAQMGQALATLERFATAAAPVLFSRF